MLEDKTKSTIKSYKDLIVWQKSLLLAIETYNLTEKFPREEIYGLTSQMRRSAISIPSNIAEGRGGGTRKDFAQFLRVSLGSCAELETQFEIAKQLLKTKNLDYSGVGLLTAEITKMLNSMIRKLNN